MITNVHVVQNDGYVTLRKSDGTTVNARVESRAPAFDIAILKVATPSPSQVVIPMGSAQSLRPGQEIVIIGSALGTLQNSVSRGIVSGLRTSGGATLVQTDAAANPGNSGGPMLDRNGSVIGITTMGYKDAEGLNFGVGDRSRARPARRPRRPISARPRGLSRHPVADRADRKAIASSNRARNSCARGSRQLADAAINIDARLEALRGTSATSRRFPATTIANGSRLLVPRGHAGRRRRRLPGLLRGHGRRARTQFRTLMQRAIDDARRANVLPGTARDLLRIQPARVRLGKMTIVRTYVANVARLQRAFERTYRTIVSHRVSICVPMQFRGDIPTPALLLDLDAFEDNISKMASHLKARNKAFRPHGKTHKCPEVAKALFAPARSAAARRG